MVKIIGGLMGASVASGAVTLTGAAQLRPFLALLKDYGIRELDTARVYNRGQSEEDVGDIPEAKHDFIIATKAPGFSPGSLSYQNVIANANASLKALKQERIPLYYFHGPDSQTPLEESCRAIHELHQQGKIERFGISNLSIKQIESIDDICTRNAWIKPSVYQGLYNPLARAGEEALLPTLRKYGMAFYAFSPLAGGFFSKTTAQLRAPPAGSRMDQMRHFKSMFVNDVSLRLHDELTAVCEKEGLTVKEATLRWMLHHSALGPEDGVILGASSLGQMEENLKACRGGPLPQTVVQCFERMWVEWQKAGKTLPATP